ncbi:GNAT family N-acetyltransferase [Paenibacillus amylolyticus]|uniref:GNAT family N-acetyltransferase n=2 Tax=Paenibacillus TaxID=44249 RepID=UPI00157FF3DB|nr:GNAT family N-acetyltransferase [Paenibacillus amylolyticus]
MATIMITYRTLTLDDVNQLQEIDRSEHIDLIYEMRENRLVELEQNHECSNWDEMLLKEIQNRYVYELEQGGMAYGAFADDQLIGFGVLAHQYRGKERNRLQVDLMYVSRGYRRQGIGKRILNELGEEAKKRGAQYLYISSTETKSAVSFYKSQGSQIASEIDQELYDKEPKDIHMIKELGT